MLIQSTLIGSIVPYHWIYSLLTLDLHCCLIDSTVYSNWVYNLPSLDIHGYLIGSIVYSHWFYNLFSLDLQSYLTGSAPSLVVGFPLSSDTLTRARHPGVLPLFAAGHVEPLPPVGVLTLAEKFRRASAALREAM